MMVSLGNSNMRKDLYFVGIFLLVMWLIWIVNTVIPYQINHWGIQPRSIGGLPGIALMPLLHDGFYHIFSNTVSLSILLFLLVGSQKQHWPIIVAIVLLNGALVWGLARSETSNGELMNHVGASGLVFGLIGFLILNGFLQKRLLSIGVAILVGFLFGGTLLSGISPRIGGQISWEGHLFGLIAGCAVAYFMSEKNRFMAWR